MGALERDGVMENQSHHNQRELRPQEGLWDLFEAPPPPTLMADSKLE